MNILCSTDEKFIPETGVMLTSLLMNNSDVSIHVFSNGDLTEKGKASLRRLEGKFGCEIHFISVDAAKLGRVPDLPWPIETYLRLLCPLYLPEDMHKVLYLDGDMVIDGSLEELWNTDLDGYSAAAVPEFQNWVSRDSLSHILQDGEYDYFNAGMLLINLDYWREHDLTSAFLETVSAIFDKIRFVDQDVLNHTLKGTVKLLPVKYNFQIYYALKEYWDMYDTGIQKQILQQPSIIHFTMLKPWYITSFGIPFRNIWNKYMRSSAWRIRERLPESKLTKRLILRYIIYPSGMMTKYGIIDKYAYRFPTFNA